MKKLIFLLSSIAIIAVLTISCEKASVDDAVNTDLTTNVTTNLKGAKWPAVKAKGLDLLWNLDAPDGYLYTMDTSNGALWGWTDNSTAYGNISAPIAYYLYKASLKEPGIAGFEAMYSRTSSDLNAFNSADLGVILYAHRATNDSKFLDLANDMAANWIAKYPSDGFPFRPVDTYWGYDAVNWMRCVYYIQHTGGVDKSLVEWADESVIAYNSDLGDYIDDDYHAVFTNVVKNVYRFGTFRAISLDDVLALGDNQVNAYARIGRTTKKELYPLMIDALMIDNGEVSEVAAELVYALKK